MRHPLELSFILTALRRRGWIVGVAIALGVLATTAVDGPTEVRYRSEALVLIAPPSATESVFNENLDRYVNGELSILRSPSLAADVSAALGEGVSASSVRQATDFEQVPTSNVVRIVATTEVPERAQAIAGTYADLYLERSTASEQAALADQLHNVNERIVQLVNEIRALDLAMQAAVAPYLAQQGQQNAPPIPSPDVLVPDIATRHQLLVNEHSQLMNRRLQVEEEQRNAASSQLVQAATDPAPVAEDSNLPIKAAIVAVAALVGIALALLTTQYRKRIADEREGEELLGRRIVARLPWAWQLRRSPLAALDRVPRTHGEDMRRLWAQADRLGPLNGTLVVAVTGVRRRSGTTTVAIELARQFAASGRRTAIIDGDGDDPWLSEAYGGRHAEGGIERILAGNDVSGALTPTGEEALWVVGRSTGATTALHREHMRQVIDAVSAEVDVVIVDSGPALATASATEACSAAHAVVLAAPLFRLTRAELEEVVSELSEFADRLLPVVTLPSRSRGSVNPGGLPELPPGERPAPAALSAVRASDGGPDQEPDEEHPRGGSASEAS